MRTHEKHRDSEKRLFLLAAILVLLSVVFLTGSLIVLAEFPRGEQSYEPGRMHDEGIFTRKEPVEEPGGAPTDAEEFPPSQLEMQEKFGALTVTDESTNAVTVVGEDALQLLDDSGTLVLFEKSDAYRLIDETASKGETP